MKLFTDSKKEYLEQIDNLWSQKKKLLFNKVRDELSWLQNSIFSTNSRNILVNNYSPDRKSKNSFPTEEVGNNAFHYAQNDPNGIQTRWNRDHGIIS